MNKTFKSCSITETLDFNKSKLTASEIDFRILQRLEIIQMILMILQYSLNNLILYIINNY